MWASQVVQWIKNPPAMQEMQADMSLIPWWGRSSGGGRGNPLHYSRLENPTDRGAWWTTVHGVTKNRTQLKQLSMYACHLYRVEEMLLRALCPAKGIPEFRGFFL